MINHPNHKIENNQVKTLIISYFTMFGKNTNHIICDASDINGRQFITHGVFVVYKREF